MDLALIYLLFNMRPIKILNKGGKRKVMCIEIRSRLLTLNLKLDKLLDSGKFTIFMWKMDAKCHRC